MTCRTPFHVLATQNPIEQEGTYPLPEAQLDRFLAADQCGLSRPRFRAPACLAHTTGVAMKLMLEPVMTRATDLIAAQALVRQMPIGEQSSRKRS